ncbi:MAG: hypothetical protein Q9157_008432 [Trypethelium eluteriae]
MFIPSGLHVDVLKTAIVSVPVRLSLEVDEQTASPSSNVINPALVNSITRAGKDGQPGVASRRDTRSRVAVLPLQTARLPCPLRDHPDPTRTVGTVVIIRVNADGAPSPPLRHRVRPRSSTPTTSPPVSQVTFDTILGHDESNQENDVAPSSQSPTRNALSTEFWQSILSATRGRRATSSGRFEPSPLRLHPIQEDDCGSSNDEATSSAITPDSYLTDEAEEEEEDEAEDAFVDAMDLVIEDGVAEGEYQMPAIPLRRLAPLEEEMDWDEEEVGEKVGVPARCEDVELDLDLNLDPRLRNGGSDWR